MAADTVAAAVSSGIVFASDSRTNAGVDQIAIYSKMTVFETPGERVVVLLSAGNLATTQSVVSLLRQRAAQGIEARQSLYDIAALVGEMLREVVTRDGAALEQAKVDPERASSSAGRGRGAAPVPGVPAGQFHRSLARDLLSANRRDEVRQADHRPGSALRRPARGRREVPDRVVRLHDALNLSVGLPIDLLGYEKDRLRVTLKRRFAEGDAYFREISQFWSAGLRRVFAEAPDVSWS